MPITLTREIAWACATDAGNRRMRRAGRTKWSLGDRNHAAAEFWRLWPLEREFEARGYSEAEARRLAGTVRP